MRAKKIIFRILLHVGCENGKYLASIIDDSVITYDEIMKKTKHIPTKTVPTKSVTKSFNKKR